MNKSSSACDFLVIGAGVAGLRAAIELASSGHVMVLAKREIRDSATHYAQGGIAAALSDEDEVSLHLQDTLVAGDGLCNEEAVRVLVEEGPARIEELIDWGTQFDRNGTKLAFTREGAHSRNRILHAHGDSTGREILRALYAKAKTLKNISVLEFEMSSDLLLEDGRVVGVSVIGDKGQFQHIPASAVLLATGGLGQLYRNTTNPEVATGDGVAMAYLAGAEVSDMEFVQFHPTALYLKKAPRFLLSEALRGEGAYLRNMELHRFMSKYHPQGELAPRDVVARAIVHELEVTQSPDPVVYLDLTHLDAEHVKQRFRGSILLASNITSTSPRNSFRSAPPHTTPWVECVPISLVRPASPDSTLLEKPPPLACTVPIVWPAILCSRGWSTAHVQAKPCATLPDATARHNLCLDTSRMTSATTIGKISVCVNPTPGNPRCSCTGSLTSSFLPEKSRPYTAHLVNRSGE